MQLAGKKWYYSFMKRHPELSLHQPQSVSLARSKGGNKENIAQFFYILENLWMKTKLRLYASVMWMNQRLPRFRRNPQKL
jgi:hypothetical protein